MKIAEIEKLTKNLFRLRWNPFHEESFADPNLRFPGVYLLAYTGKNLNGQKIDERNILYVGMSNAQGGVRSRLIQFRNGLEKYDNHSGAMRFYREYQGNKPFSLLKGKRKFFYVALSVECISEKSRLTAQDFRELGHVTCLEYYAIARIKEKAGRPPPLNKFGKRPNT